MTRVRVKLKGVHRVRMSLADGSKAQYHYAWRGGPRFWHSGMAFGIHSIEYVEAFREATKVRSVSTGHFQEVINTFFASDDFTRLGERTQRDHRRNISMPGGIEETFGKVPREVFEDPRIRARVLAWSDSLSPSARQQALTTLQRIISFAFGRKIFNSHHLLNLKRKKKTNRADVVWTPEEVQIFCDGAPRFVSRILVAAIETGLRPGDLMNLKRSDIQAAGGARGRILLTTSKSSGRTHASIPLSDRMARLIDETPPDQEHIIVGAEGKPYTAALSLGRNVSEWRDRLGIRKKLRLYDARGTMVARLVDAGCTMPEIASHMGWGAQHASMVLSAYAAFNPEMSRKPRDVTEHRPQAPGPDGA